METTSIIALLIAAVGSSELIKWIRSEVDRKRRSNGKYPPIQGIKYNDAQYDIMNRIKAETNFGQVLIMKASNGGGMFSPGEKIYITCTAEVFDSPLSSEKSNYDSVEASPAHIKAINQMASEGKLTIDIDSLPEEQKQVYEAKGVKSSSMVFLAQDAEEINGRTSHKIYFMVLNSCFKRDEAGRTGFALSHGSSIQTIDTRISEMRNLFGKMYSKSHE